MIDYESTAPEKLAQWRHWERLLGKTAFDSCQASSKVLAVKCHNFDKTEQQSVGQPGHSISESFILKEGIDNLLIDTASATERALQSLHTPCGYWWNRTEGNASSPVQGQEGYI